MKLLFVLLFKFPNALVVYVTNPPITYFASLLLNNQYIIIVYDIYPDALKNIGIKDNSLIFRIWGNINRKVLIK